MPSRPASGSSIPPGRPATRRWAIVTRLATAYTAASVILLAAAGVSLYDGLRAELRLENGAHRFNPYFARVIDSAGTIDDETQGMLEVLPPGVFPEPVPPQEDPSRGQYWTAADGRTFLLLAAYRRRLAVTLGIGVLVSVFAGIVIARRGLRPIRLMTDTVRGITLHRLDSRVSTAGWPTELAGLAAAFDEVLERLEESFERLGSFSDDIAHELRTPINNILGQTEVALERARSSAISRQVLESNLEETQRIVALIDGLLFLSRADHAVTALRRTAFDVRQVLEFTVERAQASLIVASGRARLRPVTLGPTCWNRSLSP